MKSAFRGATHTSMNSRLSKAIQLHIQPQACSSILDLRTREKADFVAIKFLFNVAKKNA